VARFPHLKGEMWGTRALGWGGKCGSRATTREGAGGLPMWRAMVIVQAMIASRVGCYSRVRARVCEGGAFLLLLMGAAALPAGAQAGGNSGQAAAPGAGSTAAAGADKLAFDVASVRVSSQRGFIKGWDFLDPVSKAAPPQGGLFSWNVPLTYLIFFAYDLRSMATAIQVSSALPKWAQSEWYAVEARAEGNPTRADVREMVRSLLADRFQFSAHTEKRQGEVYALEVAKRSPGLKPHTEGAPCTLPASLTDENKYPHAYPPYKQVPVHCGFFNRQLSRVGERRLEMLDLKMQQIGDSLGMPLTVVDHTGLEGHYDAVLDIGLATAPPNPDTSDEIGLPLVPEALQKQLGLKLEKQSAQVDYFAIDHIGTLTEN
jgi:uncharacterized protein (TIGR03435 family)